MKRLLVILVLATSPAIAQQAPDPAASTCGSLVGESASRIVTLATQLAQANAKIADLQKQIDAAKPKADAAPEKAK